MSDTPLRSLTKTISWRVTGSFTTFLISYIILGNFSMAGTIAFTQIIANTILYYIHERVWERANWGKSS